MLRTTLKFTALGLALVSSFFLIKGSSGLTAKDIVELAQDRWDFNFPVAYNLVEQSQNAKIGLFLILASFVLQGIDLMWPLKIKDFGIEPWGVVFAVVVCIGIAFSCHYGSKQFIKQNRAEIDRIVEQEIAQ